MTSVAAIIPVRGHARLLDGVLAALRAQTTPLDELVVVDDSPGGDLGDVGGATVVRSGGVGPYAARNLGVAATSADVLLFLDARSRPRPGWVAGVSAPFEDDSVALSGSAVLVANGDTPAERAAHQAQFFKLTSFLRTPFFMPYLPTCNLGIRHTDFDAVGGFSGVRSGGDADLCWRVLSRPGRRIVGVDDVLMDWIPRTTVREYLEQTYRYGGSNHVLRSEWRDRGAPQKEALGRLRLGKRIGVLATRYGVASLRRDADVAARVLVDAGGVATELGYRVATDRSRRAGGGRA